MAEKKPIPDGKFSIPSEYMIRHHSVEVFIDGGTKSYDLGFTNSFDSAMRKAEALLEKGFWQHEEGGSTLFSPQRISEVKVTPLE